MNVENHLEAVQKKMQIIRKDGVVIHVVEFLLTTLGEYILKKTSNEYFHDPVKCQEMCEIEISCTIMYEQLKYDCKVPRFEFRNTYNEYLFQLQVINISFMIEVNFKIN